MHQTSLYLCGKGQLKDLPNRKFRHKWRHINGKIEVDNSVADLPVVLTTEERLTALESL